MMTCAGDGAPQNTALPSMAGVKSGWPLMVSTTRNQMATEAAPMQPAMKPSRRMRFRSIAAQYIAPRRVRARLAAHDAPPVVLRILLVSGCAAVRDRRCDAPIAHRRRRRPAHDDCPNE